MEKYISQNGIKYEPRGEQYYPMLEISEQEEHKISKYTPPTEIVAVASSSNNDPSVRNKVVKVISRLFRNDMFTGMVGIHSNRIETIRNSMIYAVKPDVTENDIKLTLSDSSKITKFLERAFSNISLTSNEWKDLHDGLNANKLVLDNIVTFEFTKEGLIPSTSIPEPEPQLTENEKLRQRGLELLRGLMAPVEETMKDCNLLACKYK